MSDTGHTRSRSSVPFWLVLGVSLACVALSFVPLDMMTRIGVAVSPTGTLQDKTLLLFLVLKPTIFLLGAIGLGWILTPRYLRTLLIDRVYRSVVYPSRSLLAILLLATLIRVGWVIYFPTKPYADSEWYFRNASELAAGHGYVYDLESRKPLAAWPIGYPAFLSLLFRITGPSTLIAHLANIALGTYAVWLTYKLSHLIFNRGVGLLSALFLAVLPGFFTYSSLITTDVLFLVLTTAALYLTIHEGRAPPMAGRGYLLGWLTGLVNGALILTRPTGLALLPLWILIRWLTVDRRLTTLWRWTTAMCVGAFLVVAPWTLRNYLRFDKLIIVSNNGGANFWIGNNPLAYGGFTFPRDPLLNPLLRLIGDEVAVEETGYELGLDFIREQPRRALALLPAKVFYLYNSNDFGLVWNRGSALAMDQPGTGLHMFVLTNTLYTVLGLTAVFGLLVLGIHRAYYDHRVWIGVITTIYWTFVHLPFFGQDRFALPLLPFLTMYAAYGIVAFVGFDRKLLRLAYGADVQQI